jgi:hypothetical protein
VKLRRRDCRPPQIGVTLQPTLGVLAAAVDKQWVAG